MNPRTSPRIQVRDRQTGTIFDEVVYGEASLRWTYGTWPGLFLEKVLLSRRGVSALLGVLQDSPSSVRKIAPFIHAYGIRMEEFEPGPVRSFNEFFSRKFKPGARRFSDAPTVSAFAEARYLAWQKSDETTHIPVKGALLSPRELLGGTLSEEQTARLAGGPLLLARLCPTDYHRFHFPDSGQWLSCQRVAGRLHSVNPLALSSRPRTFLENERQISVLECDSLGLLAYVEVGALGVGKIVQSRASSGRFQRGEEKGYFLFGGSTVIVLGENGRWSPSSDLLENTSQGLETLVQLGECVGSPTVSMRSTVDASSV
jgi:phosphatidylserine decarboxylase